MSHYNSSDAGGNNINSNSNKNNRFQAQYNNQHGLNRANTNTTMDYYDSGYVYVEQLPLIKLNLTPHYGTEMDDKSSIFYVNNTRTVTTKLL